MAEDRGARHIGIVIRQRRVEAGLSQEEVAEAADLHSTYISLLERGKRNPSLATLLRLARALKCSASSLVEEVERRLRRRSS